MNHPVHMHIRSTVTEQEVITEHIIGECCREYPRDNVREKYN
jgi:hypothetical protein